MMKYDEFIYSDDNDALYKYLQGDVGRSAVM